MLPRVALKFARLTQARTITTKAAASLIYLDQTQTKNPAVSTTPTGITPQQRDALDAALRVDQAGEVAANWIYMGQMAVLGRDPKTNALLQVNNATPSARFIPLTRQCRRCGTKKRNILW